MTYPEAVQAELAMLCRELDMDSALVSEITGGREVVRWAAGEGDYATVSRNPDVIQAYMGAGDG